MKAEQQALLLAREIQPRGSHPRTSACLFPMPGIMMVDQPVYLSCLRLDACFPRYVTGHRHANWNLMTKPSDLCRVRSHQVTMIH